MNNALEKSRVTDNLIRFKCAYTKVKMNLISPESRLDSYLTGHTVENL